MFVSKINWVHLHFTIVLLLALITFLAGIETATGNKVSCNSLMCSILEKRMTQFAFYCVCRMLAQQ